jgi:hypothetical protein
MILYLKTRVVYNLLTCGNNWVFNFIFLIDPIYTVLNWLIFFFNGNRRVIMRRIRNTGQVIWSPTLINFTLHFDKFLEKWLNEIDLFISELIKSALFSYFKKIKRHCFVVILAISKWQGHGVVQVWSTNKQFTKIKFRYTY